MRLQQAIKKINELYYNDKSYYKQIIIKSNELLELLGNCSIESITAETIKKKYLDKLKAKGNTPATINNKLVYLSSILKFYNHKIKLPWQKIKDKKTRYLHKSTNELETILNTAQQLQYNELITVIVIGVYAGMRISEILNLNPEDIEEGYIRCANNKVNRSYSVPIAAKLKPYLENFQGFSLSYDAARYQFNKVCKLANISGVTLHTLRHTFCSWLVQENVPLPIIRVLANHKSYTTTLGYAHIANKNLEEAIQML